MSYQFGNINQNTQNPENVQPSTAAPNNAQAGTFDNQNQFQAFQLNEEHLQLLSQFQE